jgi:Flp pilus assembly protein TadG
MGANRVPGSLVCCGRSEVSNKSCSASKCLDGAASRRRRAGTAIVELTLCLPVLVGLALGTLQYGYSFFVYGELEQAVRAAGRYASLRPYGSATTTPDPDYLTAVQNVAVYGDPAGGTNPIAPGLTTDQVAVTMIFVHGAPGEVTVAINGYNLPQIISSVALTNKPYTKFPFLGIFAPPVT